MFLFSKKQEIPDQKQNQKTKKMTDKESDSLNLHSFLPTKGKTPLLPYFRPQTTFMGSKAHSKDRHPLLTVCCAYKLNYCFARSKSLLRTKTTASSAAFPLLLDSVANSVAKQVANSVSKKQKGFKQHKQVSDNVKTKHVLKPVRSCWVENRNNSGKPFNSHPGKQQSFSNKKLVEKGQRPAYGKSQFKRNTNFSNKYITSRNQIRTARDFDKAKTGVIYLYYTSNNTVCTLVDFKGVTKGWSSCGSLGFKSARKSTAYASQATAERIGLKAKEVGFKWVFVVLKGVGRGKESGVRALRKSGIEILGILEKTGIPHNGCRAPRKRRI